jgi:hypothetical protein
LLLSFGEVNPYGFKDPLLLEKDQDFLGKYMNDEDRKKIENFCTSHFKKSENYRKITRVLFNNYNFATEQKNNENALMKDEENSPLLIENVFVVYGHLPSVQKYLKASKLNIRTLEDFCKAIIDNRKKIPLAYFDLSRYYNTKISVLFEEFKSSQSKFKDIIEK